jgi:hypothetical protein
MLHRIYLSPGMFGFGRLAAYDYFAHLERGLIERLRAAGDDAEVHVARVAPNASIRRRALKLTELVAETCEPANASGGPIHLIGHSTGGLDARLVASPTVSLAGPQQALAWRARLASVTTINAPHYGTPLATFFTTASGQRVLRALSALTVVALSLGSPPLSVAGALVAAFGRVDRAIGLDIKVLERTTETLLRQIDGVRSREVRDYIDMMREDNGAMVQLMPEAMDLFIAGVEDRPGVFYQSVVSMAPPPSTGSLVRSLRSPWSALSSAIFAILYSITAEHDRAYPCAPPAMDAENEQALLRAFGRLPELRESDGVVPARSQVWGRITWAGYADHLDVLGHFDGGRAKRNGGAAGSEPRHVDWLCSRSHFDGAQFAAMLDAVVSGLVRAGRDGGGKPLDLSSHLVTSH